MSKISKSKKTGGYKQLLIVCAILLVIIIGSTYAWLTNTTFSKGSNTIIAGTLSLKLDEHEYINISGENALPITRETALNQTNNIYNFDLSNDGNIDSQYTIYLEVGNENGEGVIPSNLIRYIFTKNSVALQDQLLSEAPKETLEGVDKGKIVLDSSTYDNNSVVLKPGLTNQYSLRIWIDESATTAIANHEFSAKIKVVATQTDI